MCGPQRKGMVAILYFENDALAIRDLCSADVAPIVAGEIAQGWLGACAEKYEMRLRDAAAGRSIALCAAWSGEPVGYVNVYFQAGVPFDRTGWPEIVDFGVLEIFRRRGIGTALLDTAERLAGERSDTVCLGVGMHSGYGSAQRMYVKRGYVPDGTGVWYQDQNLAPYAPCVNDDDLVLWLSKRLR